MAEWQHVMFGNKQGINDGGGMGTKVTGTISAQLEMMADATGNEEVLMWAALCAKGKLGAARLARAKQGLAAWKSTLPSPGMPPQGRSRLNPANATTTKLSHGMV